MSVTSPSDLFVFAGKVYRRHPTHQIPELPTTHDAELIPDAITTNGATTNNLVIAGTTLFILTSLSIVALRATQMSKKRTLRPNEQTSSPIARTRAMSGDSLVIRRWSTKTKSMKSSSPLITAQSSSSSVSASLKGLVSAMNQDLSSPLSALRKTSLNEAAQQFLLAPNDMENRERLRREAREWISAREWFADSSTYSENDRVIETITRLLFQSTYKLSTQDVLIWLSCPNSSPRIVDKICHRCGTVNSLKSSTTQTLLPMSEFRRVALLDALRSIPLAQVQDVNLAQSERIFLQALACDLIEPDTYFTIRPRWNSNFTIMTFLLEEKMEFAITIKCSISNPTSLFAFLDSLRLDGWKRPAVGVVVHGRGLYGRSTRPNDIDMLAKIVDGEVEVYFHHLFPTRLREFMVSAVRGTPHSTSVSSMLDAHGVVRRPPSLARLLFSNAEFPNVFAVRVADSVITTTPHAETKGKLQKVAMAHDGRVEVIWCAGLVSAQTLSFEFDQFDTVVVMMTQASMAFIFSRRNETCVCPFLAVLKDGE